MSDQNKPTISIDQDEFIFEQKYRPATLAEVIIPQDIKDKLYSYIGDGRIPSFMFFSPSPGTGKTTTAKALAREVGCSNPLFINASKDTSIDVIRQKVLQYATTVSVMAGQKQKVVILDEADRLSPAAQDSLKGIMESVSKNCSFILTANSEARVNKPLLSRCRKIDFIWKGDEITKLKVQVCKRMCEILDIEQVPYDKKAVLAVVNRFYPDNRSIIGALQDYAQQEGRIDINIVTNLSGNDVEALVGILKLKDFQKMSQWVMDNVDHLGGDFYSKLFRYIYPDVRISESVPRRIKDSSVPDLVDILGEEQKWHATTPDPYLHMVRVFTMVMLNPNIQFI